MTDKSERSLCEVTSTEKENNFTLGSFKKGDMKKST